MKVNIFWFRRDLRLDDNTALTKAFAGGIPVLLLFIFDINIIEELPADDARISFIYRALSDINDHLLKKGSSLLILKGDPELVWRQLMSSYEINAVFTNKDYEPYSISGDVAVEAVLREKGVSFFRFKDQVIFEEKEIMKSDNTPYTLFTPYKNNWLRKSSLPGKLDLHTAKIKNENYFKCRFTLPSLTDLGFRKSTREVRSFDLSVIGEYDKYRDYPSMDKTSYLGPHLRYGTVSIRKIVRRAFAENSSFLSELVWREFFMQILFNFPEVVTRNFRSKYDNIPWRNNEGEFEKWKNGQTGYPIVDAGMRQLNETGYMHNRVRMITAGFLCKHLLTDWRWGEAYFAIKLLDYELASNNGNWQWAAGTGCDAAQYFRVFNPRTQLDKFDHKREYIRKWVLNIDDPDYPGPVVEHDFARRRVMEAFRSCKI